MGIDRGRYGACSSGIGALVAVLLWTVPLSALDLRIQGRSNLATEVRTAGTRILVSGQLRDDLEQPLPHRTVDVQVLEEVTRERVAGGAVDSNRNGRYSASFDVSPGEYRVRVTFEATPHVVGTQAEETLRVQPEPVELRVDGPRLVRPVEGAIEVRVRASVGGTGIALPIRVRGDGSEVLQKRLDRTGRKRVDVSELLEAGRNRIRVTVPGDSYRKPTTEQTDIWFAPNVQIEASAASVFERFERGAAVSGRVTVAGEPLPDAAVEATLVREGGAQPVSDAGVRPETGHASPKSKGRFTEDGTTDASGRFRILFNRDQLDDGAWSASVRVVPDLGAAVEQEAGSVEIDRTVSRIIVNGAAGIALLAVVLLLLRETWRAVRRRIEVWRRRSAASEKRRRAFEEEATLEAVPVREEDEIPGAPGPADGVRGQVWDVWRQHPVSGASVELRDASTGEGIERAETGADGFFVLEDLEARRFELAIEAQYYVRGRFEFEIPHDGRLHPCRFELLPVPLKIRRLYQSLIELAHGDDLWGELSPSEIREALSDVLEGAPARDDGETRPFLRRIRNLASGDMEELESSRDYLEALTGLVEETYFGPRHYDESTWRVAREIALKLRERLEADG